MPWNAWKSWSSFLILIKSGQVFIMVEFMCFVILACFILHNVCACWGGIQLQMKIRMKHFRWMGVCMMHWLCTWTGQIHELRWFLWALTYSEATNAEGAKGSYMWLPVYECNTSISEAEISVLLAVLFGFLPVLFLCNGAHSLIPTLIQPTCRQLLINQKRGK